MTDTVESRLRDLIDRHTTSDGTRMVNVAELHNVLRPGSAPMYPNEFAFAATCSTCAPNGDGRTKPWSQTKPTDRWSPVSANKELKETSNS